MQGAAGCKSNKYKEMKKKRLSAESEAWITEIWTALEIHFIKGASVPSQTNFLTTYPTESRTG